MALGAEVLIEADYFCLKFFLGRVVVDTFNPITWERQRQLDFFGEFQVSWECTVKP